MSVEINIDDLFENVDIPLIKDNNYVEIEAKIKNTKDFNKLLTYMKENKNDKITNSVVYGYPNNIRQIIENNNISYEKKTNLKKYYKYSNIYNFIISISNEEKIMNLNTKQNPLYIRKRERHSFELSKDYQLDLTIVDENNVKKREIEIEYIGEFKNFDNNSFIKEIEYIYSILTGSEKLISQSDINNLVSNVNNVLNIQNSKNFIHTNIFVKARNIKFADLVYGGIVGNPLVSYNVSHKIDGLFKMLIVNKIGLWLQYGNDYNLLVKLPNIEKTSVYICEMLYNINNIKYVLLVYDCIIYNNENITNKNLAERVSHIPSVLNLNINDNYLTILEKKSHNLDVNNFFNIIRMLLLEQETLIWPQDGFIFTPNGIYNPHSDLKKLNVRNLVDYADVCKWKPFHKITIDFKIHMNKQNIIELYVYDVYNKKETIFKGSMVNPLVENMLSNKFYSNINLYNNHIVECSYDPICNILTPIKIRYDKFGPNHLDIAVSNWMDLHDPITIEDLYGKTITLDNKYHNNIKNMLYGLPTIYPPISNLNIKPSYNLLDIGSGRGGDLTKWLKSKVNHVIVVEPNNNNLNTLNSRLKNYKNFSNHVTTINTVGEDTKQITSVVSNTVSKVDVISLMLSLSFFWANTETLDSLVQTIVHNLNMNGYIIFLTIDGVKLNELLQHNNPLILNDISFTLYENKFVYAEIPGIVGKQWEFLVNIDELTKKLNKYGIELLMTRSASDELLLGDEYKIYSSLYTYGIYQKTKNVKTGDIIDIIIPPVIYPIIPNVHLTILKDDESKKIKNSLNISLVRIGCLNNIYHAILKAIYNLYQETNNIDTRNKLAEEFSNEVDTLNIIDISNQLDYDIYIFEYQENDLLLKEHTFNCERGERNAILLLNIENHYELLGYETIDNYYKTLFEPFETLMLNIKGLIIKTALINDTDNNFYINALIQNIKKIYKIPVKNSEAYKIFYNEIEQTFNNPDLLSKILTNLFKYPAQENSKRIDERINTINNILTKINFNTSNMKILDIGAGDGKITTALKQYYNLNKNDVYAIDQKLPINNQITTLIYDVNGNIPLDNNSVTVILLFAVLHHIPPDIRLNLMSEIYRVLEPEGIVIIREHNDNKDITFYKFIDLIHLFWYVSSNETHDPLYMLTGQEFETLFNKFDMYSIYYDTYDEPNPQKIYHEVFIKPIDDFPYKKISMSIQDINTRFNNLKSYKFDSVKYNYNIRNIPGDWYKNKNFLYNNLLIKNADSDYLRFNLISDYFTDECRMKAKRYDQDLTPYEYWQKNKQNVINYAITNYGESNAYTLRESIFKLAGEVTGFRPTLMVGFIKMFKSKKILDFSSGWGDRLVGAIAANVDFYCGVDPNSCLHPKYKEIIEHFAKNKKRYVMIESPFEEAVLPENKTYDLILTSPPYFNLETYTNEETQSINNRDVNEWFDDFLIFSLIKAWKVLDVSGYMVIIINDINEIAHYTEKMVTIFTKITKDAEFLGVISYSNIKNNHPVNPQPCWIWKKK